MISEIHTAGRSFVAVAAVAGLVGCTAVVDGSFTRAAGSVTADGVDVEVLVTGNFPTEPLPPYGTAGSSEVGAYLEGTRLSEYAVLLPDIDPALIEPPPLTAAVLATTDVLDLVIRSVPDGTPNEMAAAARRHNFLLAFGAERFTAEDAVDQRDLTNAVLVFPDAAAARAAAAEMGAADAVEWPEYPSVPQPITGRPDAVAVARTYSDTARVTSYLPYGQYVLYQDAFAPTVQWAADLVAQTVDAQVPLIDAFEPTPPEQWADLPVDPSGLFARTVPAPAADAGVDQNLVYPPAAALHYQTDPLRSAELFDAVGVVGIAAGEATVYQTSQDDGGAQVVEALAAEAVDSMGYAPATGVLGMPNVECFSRQQQSVGESGLEYQCIGSAGKYAFEATGAQEDKIHQLMAAQYLMLTAG